MGKVLNTPVMVMVALDNNHKQRIYKAIDTRKYQKKKKAWLSHGWRIREFIRCEDFYDADDFSPHEGALPSPSQFRIALTRRDGFPFGI